MKSITALVAILFLWSSPNAATTELKEKGRVCLTREEELLYSMIMDYRREHRLPPIPISAKLTEVAKAHAIDLVENYDFDPGNECNPHSWSKKGNWTACCYTSDHKKASCMWEKPKEIAGYQGSGYEIAYYSSGGANAKEGLDGWKISPGHNPLLVNEGIWQKMKWKAIGIALYKEYGLVWFGDIEDESKPDKCDSK